jgi:hypothetical protein
MPVNPYPKLEYVMKEFMETDIYSLTKEQAQRGVVIFREDVLKPLLQKELLYKSYCWGLDLEDAALAEDEWIKEQA